MKKLETNLICCALLALLGFSIASCKKSTDGPDVSLDVNLLKSAEKYGALISEREAKQMGFEIDYILRAPIKLTT